jgi:hypothetical protein
MSGSFLDALKSGEIGGYQNLINEVYDTACAENELRDKIADILRQHRVNLRGKITQLVELIEQTKGS